MGARRRWCAAARSGCTCVWLAVLCLVLLAGTPASAGRGGVTVHGAGRWAGLQNATPSCGDWKAHNDTLECYLHNGLTIDRLVVTLIKAVSLDLVFTNISVTDIALLDDCPSSSAFAWDLHVAVGHVSLHAQVNYGGRLFQADVRLRLALNISYLAELSHWDPAQPAPPMPQQSCTSRGAVEDLVVKWHGDPIKPLEGLIEDGLDAVLTSKPGERSTLCKEVETAASEGFEAVHKALGQHRTAPPHEKPSPLEPHELGWATSQAIRAARFIMNDLVGADGMNYLLHLSDRALTKTADLNKVVRVPNASHPLLTVELRLADAVFDERARVTAFRPLSAVGSKAASVRIGVTGLALDLQYALDETQVAEKSFLLLSAEGLELDVEFGIEVDVNASNVSSWSTPQCLFKAVDGVHLLWADVSLGPVASMHGSATPSHVSSALSNVLAVGLETAIDNYGAVLSGYVSTLLMTSARAAIEDTIQSSLVHSRCIPAATAPTSLQPIIILGGVSAAAILVFAAIDWWLRLLERRRPAAAAAAAGGSGSERSPLLINAEPGRPARRVQPALPSPVLHRLDSTTSEPDDTPYNGSRTPPPGALPLPRYDENSGTTAAAAPTTKGAAAAGGSGLWEGLRPLVIDPRLPWYLRYGILLWIMGTFGLFFLGSRGIWAQIVIETDVEGDKPMSYSAEQVTVNFIVDTLRQLGNKRYDVVANILHFFCLVWPFIKVAGMLACWVVPPLLLPTYLRAYFLVLLDFCGKWSKFDSFVVVLLTISVNFTFSFTADTQDDDGTGPEVTEVLAFSPIDPWLYFFMATISSLMLTHAQMYCHRKVCYLHPRDDLGESISVSQIPILGKPLSRTKQQFVVAALAVTGVAFLLSSCICPILHIEYEGVSGWAMVRLGESAHRDYTLIDMLQRYPASTDRPLWFGTGLVTALIWLLIIAFPLTHVVLLLVMWLVPMRIGRQKKLLLVCEVVQSWSCFDVFVLALFVLCEGVQRFFIAGEPCVGVDRWAAATIPHLPGSDCVDVYFSLIQPGCWLLVIACVLHTACIVVVMQVANTIITGAGTLGDAGDEEMHSCISMLVKKFRKALSRTASMASLVPVWSSP